MQTFYTIFYFLSTNWLELIPLPTLITHFSSCNIYIKNLEFNYLFQSGTGSMGCGSSYDHRSSDPPPITTPPSAAINCDMCGNKFSFISRKRTCTDCGNVFCTTCLPNDRNVSSKSRTCARCGVLNKRPPHRGELMKLRVKDLQHFLTRKRINIKSCVGKF